MSRLTADSLLDQGGAVHKQAPAKIAPIALWPGSRFATISARGHYPSYRGWQRLRRALVPSMFCLLGAAASAQVVVVGTGNPLTPLNREQVADAFLGRMAGIEPIDLAEGNPVREAFYTKLVGKSAHQLKSYWARLEFTGKAMPPRQYRDGRELKRYLSHSPRAIAYLDKSDVDSSLRIVFESD